MKRLLFCVILLAATAWGQVTGDPTTGGSKVLNAGSPMPSFRASFGYGGTGTGYQSALATNQYTPQPQFIHVDQNRTVSLVIVRVDAGASTMQVCYRHAGTATAITPVLTPATVTGITYPVACANAAGTAVTIEGASVTCSALTNTALTAGDSLETCGGAADGTSKMIAAELRAN